MYKYTSISLFIDYVLFSQITCHMTKVWSSECILWGTYAHILLYTYKHTCYEIQTYMFYFHKLQQCHICTPFISSVFDVNVSLFVFFSQITNMKCIQRFKIQHCCNLWKENCAYSKRHMYWTCVFEKDVIIKMSEIFVRRQRVHPSRCSIV